MAFGVGNRSGKKQSDFGLPQALPCKTFVREPLRPATISRLAPRLEAYVALKAPAKFSARTARWIFNPGWEDGKRPSSDPEIQ